MHIAVIGAGISGLMSALELVEHGCSVSIFDQNAAGQAASWAGGGILSPMYPWRYPNEVNLLAQHAKPLYELWNQKLRDKTQIDFQIHETGMLIFDQDDFGIGLEYAKQYNEPYQTAQLLTQQQIQNINPKINATFQQALYFSKLCNIRNPRLLQSIICYLKQHPRVHWHEYQHIDKLSIQNNQVQAVQTKDGKKHLADQFLMTTGAWSAQWAETLELHIPIKPIHGQMLLFKTPEKWLPTMCMNKVMYMIPRQDGHILCGSSMQDIGFDTACSSEIQQHIQDAVFEMVPELKQFPLVKQWSGLRPSSPNGVPYIGQLPHIENLWMNSGHFRNGLCMAPASAQLLRELMLGQVPFLNPDLYSPKRLAEKSNTLA